MTRPLPKHGTRSGYQRHLRLGEETCARCRRAQAAGVLEANKRRSARWMSEGRSGYDGSPRQEPYSPRSLAAMKKYGFEPDPRFLWSPPK